MSEREQKADLAQDPGGVFVFAYGSNMLTGRLRVRTPSAISIGLGEIRGYRMAFNKRGADGSGKGNIQPTSDPEDRVHGVVFRIDSAELGLLDAVEVGYRRCPVQVITRWGHTVGAVSYQALDEYVHPGLRPFRWYHGLVLAGAREHGLPAHHVLWIECQEADRDPDDVRRIREWRLLE